MDGVIADYYRSILKMTKSELKSYDEWPPGCNKYEHLFGMTYDEVMQGCDHEFWASIEPTPWMNTLFDIVDSSEIEPHILTSPPFVTVHENIMPHHVGATVQGKLEWILKHKPEYYHEGRVSFSWRKYMAASEHNLLIDDSPTNIEAFTKMGGRGMLIPGLHNWRYDEYRDLIEDPSKWFEKEFSRMAFETA